MFLVCGVVSIIRNKSEDATATEDKKSISERRELTGYTFFNVQSTYNDDKMILLLELLFY